MKNLVIVESPTKARTISKFLGPDYEIKPSMGHIIDLPKSKLGVAVDDSFKPQYEIVEDKKKIITELARLAKSAETIILATDPDREGEAIAANIKDILLADKKLKLKKEKFRRIVFHEITKEAITDALTAPRGVDENLVNAQTARRILDRLVGYQLSPVLWKKVRRGLSAGRVQSVALRLIVEREREIEKFSKEPYWTIHALFKQQAPGKSAKQSKTVPEIEFSLVEIDNSKIEASQTFPLYDGEYRVTKTIIDSLKKADNFIQDIQTKSFIVADVITKQIRRGPYPPYTTSTLQQDASRRYGFSGKRTMSLAQKLYEEGFITYHRTDSVILSTSAVNKIRSYVEKTHGAKYIPAEPRLFSSKQKLAQEAHEGIRPTKINITDIALEEGFTQDHKKLYDLVWKRAVASQMSDALIESTTVYADSSQAGNSTYRFKTSGSVLLFDGFLKLTPQALQDNRLPVFTANEKLDLKALNSVAHETLPPPRYNEASLIAALEEKGIGRPSTYASIISTLNDRAYIERVEKRFEATPVGIAVNDFLVKNFSSIDDIPFTADMEDKLDNIAHGKTEWISMMNDFYNPFKKKLSEVEGADRVKIQTEEIDEKCPECTAPLIIRFGRFGKFISCSKFPECKFTKPYVLETKQPCPKCGNLPAGKQGKVIIKKTRKGRKFFGCSNYPACNFAAWKLEDIKKK